MQWASPFSAMRDGNVALPKGLWGGRVSHLHRTVAWTVSVSSSPTPSALSLSCSIMVMIGIRPVTVRSVDGILGLNMCCCRSPSVSQ